MVARMAAATAAAEAYDEERRRMMIRSHTLYYSSRSWVVLSSDASIDIYDNSFVALSYVCVLCMAHRSSRLGRESEPASSLLSGRRQV